MMKTKAEIREMMNKGYEAIKDRLMMQVINTKGNEELLRDIPHVDFADLSLVYRFVFNTEPFLETCIVTNNLMHGYGIAHKQLHADALKSSTNNFPVTIKPLQEVLYEPQGFCQESDSDLSLYIATIKGFSYGASCLCYPDFFERAAEVMKGSFYVLPSSIHEVFLCPANPDDPADQRSGTVKNLKDIVLTVNRTEVDPKEKLSDSVYYYDAKNKTFKIC